MLACFISLLLLCGSRLLDVLLLVCWRCLYDLVVVEWLVSCWWLQGCGFNALFAWCFVSLVGGHIFVWCCVDGWSAVGLCMIYLRLRSYAIFACTSEMKVVNTARGGNTERTLTAAAGPSPCDPYRQTLTMRPSLKARPLVS